MRRWGMAVLAAAALLGAPAPAVSEPPQDAVVPLVNPLGEKTGGGSSPHGMFRRVVTARGFELDDSRTGFHNVKAIGISDTFPADVPEICVVVEFLQSNFDIFRLVGRFILEDPDGKPIGTVLYTDRAQFENEDMGGFLAMKQPPGGFPVGNYRVEIHYENVTDMSLLRLARFKVVPPGAAAPKP